MQDVKAAADRHNFHRALVKKKTSYDSQVQLQISWKVNSCRVDGKVRQQHVIF